MTQLRERMLEELERRNMRLLLPGLPVCGAAFCRTLSSCSGPT